MSDFFRNLGNQGAQNSEKNTQYWLDWGESEEGKQRLAEEKAGTLDPKNKLWVDAYHLYEKKAQEQGIERSKSVSESTGVPDLTDQMAQARKKSQAMQLVTGRGRRASMMNGEYDDSMLGGF